jgi:hypothetical protein
MKVGDIISNGFRKGLQNFLPLLVNFILWGLTIWIPYLNVGTTIGLMVIAAKMSKNQTISYTEIFNPEYRKRMGEFILVSAFVGMGTALAALFLFVPGAVIAIAWSLAPLLVIDKNMEPLAAIKKSNDLTYGKKWTIFFGLFLTSLIVMIALGIVAWLLSLLTGVMSMMIAGIIMGLVSIGMLVLFASISMGAASYIYGELVKG